MGMRANFAAVLHLPMQNEEARAQNMEVTKDSLLVVLVNRYNLPPVLPIVWLTLFLSA
jgi:hypothetical protein